MKKDNLDHLETEDFSIVLGGPFFQFLRSTKLSGNGLEQSKRRTIVFALITWLPLFIFSVFAGKAFSNGEMVPFIEDVGVHIRYLVALPLMILAELLVHQRMRVVVKQFVERKLIPEESLDKFYNAIGSAFKLRNSLFAEATLIVFVYVVGVHFIWRPFTILDATAWYTYATPEGNKLTLAGIWFGYVSTPLFQFLILRWYYRIFIWSRFLWQVSKIKLNLNPMHPDRVGGLGFLSSIDSAFLPLALVHGAFLAGLFSERIFHANAILTDFKVETVVIVVLVLILFLLPLLFFTSQLAQCKRKGVIKFGQLSTNYVRNFDEKWLQKQDENKDELLGSADIQSLADLTNSYEVVRKMQFTPITKESILTLAIMTILPIVPLSLTMMPFEELAKKIIEIVL